MTKVINSKIFIGDVCISFNRTLRVPLEDTIYKAPPALGIFPVYCKNQYRASAPSTWASNDFFLAVRKNCLYLYLKMFPWEAMMIEIACKNKQQQQNIAIKLNCNQINLLNGRTFVPLLCAEDNDHMLISGTNNASGMWIDGAFATPDLVRQFAICPITSHCAFELAKLQLFLFAPKMSLLSRQQVRTISKQQHSSTSTTTTTIGNFIRPKTASSKPIATTTTNKLVTTSELGKQVFDTICNGGFLPHRQLPQAILQQYEQV